MKYVSSVGFGVCNDCRWVDVENMSKVVEMFDKNKQAVRGLNFISTI